MLIKQIMVLYIYGLGSGFGLYHGFHGDLSEEEEDEYNILTYKCGII
jgi:hypothetical protein